MEFFISEFSFDKSFEIFRNIFEIFRNLFLKKKIVDNVFERKFIEIILKKHSIMVFFITNFLSKSFEKCFSNTFVSNVFEKILSRNNLVKTLHNGIFRQRFSLEIFRIFCEDHQCENSMDNIFDKII